MELTIFAKRRSTRDGDRKFFSYLTTMKRRDGSKITASVRFREACGQPRPDECPMNIIVEKRDANLSERDFIDKQTGEFATGYTLWVSAWTHGAMYVDHSLDDFE